MRIISCSMEDISSLAVMNKHLIEDDSSFGRVWDSRPNIYLCDIKTSER